MMVAKVVVLAVLSQQYVRSRVDEQDSGSQCLWWLEGTTITWRMDAAGNPETPAETELTALERAFGTWQAQMETCGNLTLAQGARTNSRKVGYIGDGTDENVVLFRTVQCKDTVASSDPCWSKDADDCGNVHDCWQFSSAAIAITTTSYGPSSGRIFDSDIELNGVAFLFTTVDSPVCPTSRYQTDCVATDVQNTATHEIGHLLGLGHAASTSSTMSYRADPGELSKRVLDPGTAQFVCEVYPKGGASKTCVTPVLTDTLGKAGCQAASGPIGVLGLLGALLSRRRRRG
jgi:hypothetical protein